MQGYIYCLKEDYEQAASLIGKAVEEGYDKALIYQSRLLRAQGMPRERTKPLTSILTSILMTGKL